MKQNERALKQCRFLEIVHVRVTSTLKNKIAAVANSCGIDKSDFIRLCLYQGVDRYYLKKDRRAELLQELGRLSTWDLLMLVKSKQEGV